MNIFEIAINASNELLRAGQASKSKIAEANRFISRAYDEVVEACNDAVFADAKVKFPVFFDEDAEYDEANEEVKGCQKFLNENRIDVKVAQASKAKAIFEKYGFWSKVEALVELRASIKKNVTVVARPVKEIELEASIKDEVLKSFEEESAERKAQFDWSVNAIKAFDARFPGKKSLAIGVDAIECGNEFGTRWLRFDWSLAGKRVAFAVIEAAVAKVDAE